MTVQVSARQASQIYRELREMDTVRRAARRTARHRGPRPAARHRASAADVPAADPSADLARETVLQAALLLVEPYVAEGGPMSRGLAKEVVGLLAEADELADGLRATAQDSPEQLVADAADRVLLRASLLAALDGDGGGGYGGIPQQRGPLER
jgi:hypothetical protein